MEHLRRSREERNGRSLAGKLMIGLGALAAGYLAYKYIKKAKQDIELEEKRSEEIEKELVEEIGLRNDQISEFVEDPNEVTKTLYDCIKRSPKWDIDVIDSDLAIESEKTVHVRRFDSNGRPYLELMFEIPNGDINKVPMYISEYNKEFGKLEIYKVSGLSPETNITKVLKGFVGFTAESKEGEELYSKLVHIPESYLQKFSDNGRRRSLTTFVKSFLSKSIDQRQSLAEILEMTNTRFDSDVKVEFKCIYLYYSVVIPLTIGEGIDMIGTLKLLRYIIEELGEESVTNGKKNIIKQNHLLFHTVNEEGQDDLTYFYDTDVETGETIKNSYLL